MNKTIIRFLIFNTVFLITMWLCLTGDFIKAGLCSVYMIYDVIYDWYDIYKRRK